MRLKSQNPGHHWPIVHPSGKCEWRAVVMMMVRAGNNSWLVYQSSLAVLLAETSGANRRNGRWSENFAYSVSLIRHESLTCRKILRHGTSGFTSHPKEGVLRFLSPLKIHRLGRVLNPRPLGPVVSTLANTPPRGQMWGSGQRHAPAALYPWGKDPGSHWIEV
jgi:hypothetical protein